MGEKESFCLFCSLGCKFAIKVEKGVALSPEFCPNYPTNEGRLCPKGLYAIELLNHPRRLTTPLIKEGERFKEVSWDESLRLLASKISEVKGKYGSESIGIIIDPNHTNEEILAIQKLAKIIGTHNFACSFPPNDWGLLRNPGIFPPEKIEDLEDVNCCLILGDPFAKHPVIAKRVIASKYKARGNSIIVIAPERTNTAWFANTHLQNRPGSEALLLVGLLKSILSFSEEGQEIRRLEKIPDEAIFKATGIPRRQIAGAARTFNDAEKGMIILCPSFKGIKDISSVACICKLLVDNAKGNKGLMPLFTYGNAVGAFNISLGDSWRSSPGLMEEASSGKVKLLIDFGEDLLSSYPSAEVQGALNQLEFLALSSTFAAETERFAHLVLPCASWLEKGGRVNFFDSRGEVLEPVIPPPGAAKSDLEIISELSKQLGTPLDQRKIREEAQALSKENLEQKGIVDINKLVEKINNMIKEATTEEKEYPYLLVSGDKPTHFADGSITRNFSWSKEQIPSPFIELNLEDAGEIGVKEGDEVLVSSRSGEVALPVQATTRLLKGMVSAPSYSPEVRSIFEWKIDLDSGGLETGPERVSLRAKRSNPRK